MTDVIVLAVVLSLFVVVIDYLSRVFADTHPEFLPFLKIVRWFVFFLGAVVGIGAFISILVALVSLT